MFIGIDFLVVVIYLIIIISVGLLLSRKKSNTSEYFFFTNRNIDWFIVGSALFASNIGSEHFGRINHLSYN